MKRICLFPGLVPGIILAACAAGSCAAVPGPVPGTPQPPACAGAGAVPAAAGTAPKSAREGGDDSVAAEMRKLREAIDRAQQKLREFDNQRTPQ
jgi:hypothetical protein